MTDFQKVSKWLKENCDVDVKLGQTTSYIGGSVRTIFIHHNYNLEKNGLIALLHEAGHAIQPSEDEDIFGPSRYKVVDDLEHPKEFKMLQFLNEVDAWDRGESIALELNIQLDKKRWTKEKEEALLTYYVS
jgi:hypothetical protein